MLLSIVIPFYHVEAYIGACLERLAGMPQEEVELLRIFEALDVKGRTALLSAAFDLEEKIPVRPDDEEV